jgi:hypothetical protein
MIGQFIAKRVAGAVIKKVMEKRAIKKMREYVEEPNDADKRIDELELKVARLERFSHERADFVCTTCGNVAKRVSKKNKRRK